MSSADRLFVIFTPHNGDDRLLHIANCCSDSTRNGPIEKDD